MANQDFKRFYTLVETLKVHGEIEYGTDEIDIDALVNFLHSQRNIPRFFNCDEKEVEQCVLQDILDGMPVWRFFKLPAWTKRMLQKEYDETVREEKKKARQEYIAARKKYKCLQQCKYYDCADTPFGVYVKCNGGHPLGGLKHRRMMPRSGDDFKYKMRCSCYEKDESKPKNPIYVGNN